MSEKLKQMSLKQAAEGITPMAGTSATVKGSKSVKVGSGKAARKKKKKSAKKQLAQKVAAELLDAEASDKSQKHEPSEAPSEPPPLPPPNEEPEPGDLPASATAAAMPEASAGPLLGKKLRVVKMNYLCGKEGLCVGHNIVTDSVTLTVGDKLEKKI